MVDSWKVRPVDRAKRGTRCQGRPWPASPSTSVCLKAWKSPATNAAARATVSKSPGPGPRGAGVNAAYAILTRNFISFQKLPIGTLLIEAFLDHEYSENS